MKSTWTALALVFSCCIGLAEESGLPGTKPLETKGDLSVQMVSGISKFLDAETARSIEARKKHWHYDFTSKTNYEASVDGNRDRFRKIIGAVDARFAVRELEFISGSKTSATVAETKDFTIFAVRWPVFENVDGEGLWIKPKRPPVAQVVAIPDADQTPEMLMGLAPGIKDEAQFARRLAENGCEVLIPTLVSRSDTWSGNPKINRFTNQPHREWIYRQAYEMGRHIIGYEVQKVLAAVDFFRSEPGTIKGSIGVAGYGEGGLLALYAAALDKRIDGVLVSGYFGSRQRVWEEPIYRNVFGLLEEFGDAEIASLTTPRRLVVEYSLAPSISGPPPPHDGRAGAAPGKIATSDFEAVSNEVNRLKVLLQAGNGFTSGVRLIDDEGTAIG
ncbi:MAG: hypothetical protein JWM68_3226, partial [Verrucomicrobiales bacterium]|nr:hypothetical protein [Verrucomicrobiales bacterium]